MTSPDFTTVLFVQWYFTRISHPFCDQIAVCNDAIFTCSAWSLALWISANYYFFKLVDVRFASQVWHQPIWKLPIPSPIFTFRLCNQGHFLPTTTSEAGPRLKWKIPPMPPMSLAIGFWGPTIVNSTGAKLILMWANLRSRKAGNVFFFRFNLLFSEQIFPTKSYTRCIFKSPVIFKTFFSMNGVHRVSTLNPQQAKQLGIWANYTGLRPHY